MKSSKKIFVASLLTVAVSSVHAAEAKIDFENQNIIPLEIDKLVKSLSVDGIFFDTLAGNGFGIQDGDALSLFSQDDYSGKILSNGSFGFTSLKLSFNSAISDFSFNLGGNDELWKLEAFDMQGGSISSLEILPTPEPFNGANGGQLFGLSTLSPEGISYATLNFLGTPTEFFGQPMIDNISIDNIKYNTLDNTPPPPVSAIPEPSTYALMLGGLGLVGFMAYRRRKVV